MKRFRSAGIDISSIPGTFTILPSQLNIRVEFYLATIAVDHGPLSYDKFKDSLLNVFD